MLNSRALRLAVQDRIIAQKELQRFVTKGTPEMPALNTTSLDTAEAVRRRVVEACYKVICVAVRKCPFLGFALLYGTHVSQCI